MIAQQATTSKEKKKKLEMAFDCVRRFDLMRNETFIQIWIEWALIFFLFYFNTWYKCNSFFIRFKWLSYLFSFISCFLWVECKKFKPKFKTWKEFTSEIPVIFSAATWPHKNSSGKQSACERKKMLIKFVWSCLSIQLIFRRAYFFVI